MLVGIDVSAALTAGRSGVGNYTAHLAAALQRRHEAHGAACFLFFSNRGDRLFVERERTHGMGAIYPYDRLPTRMLWMQAGLPRSIGRTSPDVFHFPNHLAPLLGVSETPYVITLHDMSVYRCPRYHALKTVLTHRAIMPTAARHARLVLTVSESARQDILHYLNIPPDRVRVVYEGVGPRFRAVAQEREPSLEDIRRRYDLPERYILTVSTVEPRKNHARLVEAYNSVLRQESLPHHLVVVGARGWKDQDLRARVMRGGMAGRVHFLGYVADTDLPGIYRAASAFAFPSLYEGFGLPVLEAMACGVPCVISNDPALCEVAGRGNAIVVDPYAVPDIAAGLYQLLSDDALAARLRARGLARATAFSWERCADQTYRLYAEAAESVASPMTRRTRPAGRGSAWLPAASGVFAPSRSRIVPP